jgi:hypothetical protein
MTNFVAEHEGIRDLLAQGLDQETFIMEMRKLWSESELEPTV